MAFVNILCKSESSINWGNLLGDYEKLSLTYVEIFPIPMDLGFDQDCVGMNVHKGYLSKQIVVSELKQAIDLFRAYKLKFTELYSGVEINQNNLEAIINRLLPSS